MDSLQQLYHIGLGGQSLVGRTGREHDTIPANQLPGRYPDVGGSSATCGDAQPAHECRDRVEVQEGPGETGGRDGHERTSGDAEDERDDRGGDAGLGDHCVGVQLGQESVQDGEDHRTLE